MTALEKMASLHTESDEYHSTKLEKCVQVCASVCKGEKWEEQYMLMLTVRCATRYWPKVREGDRKRQRNAGVSTMRAARHCQLFPQKFTWRGSQQLHVVWFLPPSTKFSLLDLLCVVCHCIVDRPMGIPCRKMVCAHCISGLVLE